MTHRRGGLAARPATGHEGDQLLASLRVLGRGLRLHSLNGRRLVRVLTGPAVPAAVTEPPAEPLVEAGKVLLMPDLGQLDRRLRSLKGDVAGPEQGGELLDQSAVLSPAGRDQLVGRPGISGVEEGDERFECLTHVLGLAG